MTPRQAQILECVILEYMETAHPVGSVSMAKKYGIRVSPATVRNEMANLIKLGFLQKEHFSSGRIPTAVGFRYYLENLFSEDVLNYLEEMSIKEKLHEVKFQRDKMLRSAVELLAENLNYTAIALASDSLYYAGISNILGYSEFEDLDILKNIISVIENYKILQDIFEKGNQYEGGVKILIGDETGFGSFSACSIVYKGFRLHMGEQGYLAVVGPFRMNYKRVMPVVRYTAESLEELASGW